jgi:hypothetical protein
MDPRLEFLAVALIKIQVLCDMTPCKLVKFTDFSDELAEYNFKVQVVQTWALKMEVASPSETSATIYETTRGERSRKSGIFNSVTHRMRATHTMLPADLC